MSLRPQSPELLRCRDILIRNMRRIYHFITQTLIPILRRLPKDQFFKTWKFKRSAFVALLLLISLILYKVEVERQKRYFKRPKNGRKLSMKSNSRQNCNRNYQRIKKSISQLSIVKSYQSHSQSDIESGKGRKMMQYQESPSQSSTIKKLSIQKKNTKYCTDVDTDPHSKYNCNTLENKRDMFFFSMIDQYRHVKPPKNDQPEQSEGQIQEFACEYFSLQNQIEGENKKANKMGRISQEQQDLLFGESMSQKK